MCTRRSKLTFCVFRFTYSCLGISSIERYSPCQPPQPPLIRPAVWIQGQARNCRFRVRVRRGGRKKQVRKGQVMGKPATHGVNQPKPTRSLRCIAEERVGRKCPNLRVLNSYWVKLRRHLQIFWVILVDPSHKAIRRDPVTTGSALPPWTPWKPRPHLCRSQVSWYR